MAKSPAAKEKCNFLANDGKNYYRADKKPCYGETHERRNTMTPQKNRRMHYEKIRSVCRGGNACRSIGGSRDIMRKHARAGTGS